MYICNRSFYIYEWGGKKEKSHQSSCLGRLSFSGNIYDSLLISKVSYRNRDSNSNIVGGRELFNSQFLDDTNNDSNNYQSSKAKPVAEFSPVRKTIVDSSFIWIGVHSLEIYLIHGFSICLLKLADKPVFHSISGLVLVFLNLIITISLSFFYIKLIEKNQLLNKLLFWK